MAVDVLGLPYAAKVTTANISDIAGGVHLFLQPSFYSLSTVQTALCDGTYEGKNFADAIKELIGANVEIAKRSELHTFGPCPKPIESPKSITKIPVIFIIFANSLDLQQQEIFTL